MNETENRDQSSSNYEIDIIKYASVRKQEIDLLRNDAFLTKEDKNKSLFQLLPRHMRRRTMGYLRKRLPHRIRKLAIIKPPSKVNKRPSRKHRRRPANLLKEYDRRKRDGKVWLETHIWHAKRFHMSESLYGYRLALHDNCKSKRAAYKCLSKYACIHDESYYVCLQLEGRQEDLLQGLAKLSSSKTGLTFAAKLYLNGQFEGRTVMYEENKYPFGCIGPVRFLWKAVDDHLDDNFNRYLWIWSHPSVYKQVETQLINVFELESQTIDEFDANSNAKKRKLNEEKEKQTCDETTRSNQNPVYHSSSKHIKLKNLKDKLVRFKLLGPLSTSILANALKTFQPNECSESEKRVYKSQNELWDEIKNSIKNPNCLVQQTVFGLLVKDPRISLPKKKAFNKVQEQNEQIDSTKNSASSTQLKNETICKIRMNAMSKSTIFDRNVIDELNKEKKSTFELNKIRSNYLLPSTELKTLENHSKVPVLIIQNAVHNGNHKIFNGNLFTGWDIVLPNGWAMAFWMCLVHLGARAIGQNELNYLLFESGNLQFPNEYSDTKASKEFFEELKQTLYKKYLLRPKSKRVNYLKTGFLSPFYLPFRSLLSLHLSEMNEDFSTIEYFILRDKNVIEMFNNWLSGKKQTASVDFSNENVLNRSYVAVRLTCLNKGRFEKFSLLYANKSHDTSANEEKEKNNLAIQKLVAEYKSEFLAKLNNKQENGNGNEIKKRSKNKRFDKFCLLINEEAFQKFEIELNDCNQHEKPIGFVTSNEFTLVKGKCTANAFILTKYLLEVLKTQSKNMKVDDKKESIVNFRAPNCNTLRQARINHFLN